MKSKLATMILMILVTIAGPVAAEAGSYGRHYPPPRYRWNPRENYRHRHHHHRYRHHWHWYGSWQMGLYLPLPPPPFFGAVPAYPGAPAGAIDTDIDPEEAAIYINGKYQGQADDFDGFPSYLYLEPGTYRLEAYLSGYEPLNIDIEIRPGRMLRLSQNLIPESRWRSQGYRSAPNGEPPAEDIEDDASTESGNQPPYYSDDSGRNPSAGDSAAEENRRPPWRGERY